MNTFDPNYLPRPPSPDKLTNETASTDSIDSGDGMDTVYNTSEVSQATFVNPSNKPSKMQAGVSFAKKSSTWSLPSLRLGKMLESVKNRLRRSYKGTQTDYVALKKTLSPNDNKALNTLLKDYEVSKDSDLNTKFSHQLDTLVSLLVEKTPKEQVSIIKSFSQDKQAELLNRLDLSKLDTKEAIHLLKNTLKQIVNNRDLQRHAPQNSLKTLKAFQKNLEQQNELEGQKPTAFKNLTHLHFLAKVKKLPVLSKQLEVVAKLLHTLEPNMKEALDKLENDFSELHPGKVTISVDNSEMSVEEAIKKGMEDENSCPVIAQALTGQLWELASAKEFVGKYHERLNFLNKNLENLKQWKQDLSEGKLSKLIELPTLYLTLGNRLRPDKIQLLHENQHFCLFSPDQSSTLRQSLEKAFPFADDNSAYFLPDILPTTLFMNPSYEHKTGTKITLSTVEDTKTLSLPESLTTKDKALVDKWREKIRYNGLGINNTFERLIVDNVRINGKKLMDICQGEKYEGLKAILNDESLDNNYKLYVKVALFAEAVKDQLKPKNLLENPHKGLDDSEIQLEIEDAEDRLITERLLSAMTIDKNSFVADFQETADLGAMLYTQIRTASALCGFKAIKVKEGRKKKKEVVVKSLEYSITANDKQLNLETHMPYFCFTKNKEGIAAYKGSYIEITQEVDLKNQDGKEAPTTIKVNCEEKTIYN